MNLKFVPPFFCYYFSGKKKFQRSMALLILYPDIMKSISDCGQKITKKIGFSHIVFMDSIWHGACTHIEVTAQWEFIVSIIIVKFEYIIFLWLLIADIRWSQVATQTLVFLAKYPLGIGSMG